MKLYTAFCLAAFLASATQPYAAEMYQVGVGKADITPEYPIRLNGFGFRREESAGVSQRIWAKALAISHEGKSPIVIITIDSLGVRMPMVDAIAKQLEEKHQVPRENVVLTFSHSHCTPKVNGASDNIFSTPIPAAHQEHIDRYSKELPEKIISAAVQAIQDRKPATLEWNVGRVGFAKNRRTPGGPVDHDLPLLVARDSSGQPRAIYVSYACHCVTLSFNQISGDWSGYAQELIERKFPGVVGLVSIGCGSDSNPTSGVTGDKTDVAAQQGAEIADEVERLLKEPGRPIQGPLKAQLEFLDLPLNELPTREQWIELEKKGGPAGYNAQTQLARLDRGEKLLTAIHYPIQSLTLGDNLQMVFLAGEVCADYSLRLKKELSASHLWVNGYSNDFCAYIPSERLVKEGGYGGGGEIPYFALPATLKAGLEQQIIDEVKRQTPKGFQLQPGTQGSTPKSPEESRQCLKTHEDLKIELVAAEPLVADPVAIDFGPDGRLWIAEMTDYARGVNDEFTPTGRIRFLTDSDNDGKYDKSTEFLTGLRFPTDVKVWRNGVLICDAPDILFAVDENQDGKADSRIKMFTGFATHNPHGRVNSLRYGLDNWVYGSGGLFGGRITNSAGKMVDVTNRDFRIKPDDQLMEAVTGQTQQGRPRDDWDNWFGCTNGSLLFHHVVSDHYARRNPQIAPPPPTVSVPDYPNSHQLYPRGDLVLFKLSGQPGRPTSACGAEIYRDDLLGADFSGNSFTCEPVNQLVHRLQIKRKGVTFSGRRPAEESEQEFLTSTDRWFRPVQVRTGPDGALWIVDMYRYVIEHPQWIPPETIAELNVFAGQGLGRIYRIVPKNQPARKPLRLSELTDEQLAEAIDSPNGVQRDSAQELLVQRQAVQSAPVLARIVQSSSRPAARIQAASTLQGLNSLEATHLLRLFKHDVAEVRRHAVRLAEPMLDQSPQLLSAALELVNDQAPEVLYQLAYSLGESRSEGAASALAAIGLRPVNDVYLTSAALSSVDSENIAVVLRIVLAQTKNQKSDKFLDGLLATAAATGTNQTIAAILTELSTQGSSREAIWQWRAMSRILDAADRRELTVVEALSKENLQQVRAVLASARESLVQDQTPDDRRIAALQLLGRDVGSATRSLFGDQLLGDRDLFTRLLTTRFSPPVQSAAIAAIARTSKTDAPELLMNVWPDATPRLRTEILDTLLSRDAWLPDLLASVESGLVRPGEMDAVRRERLTAHRDEPIRVRAERALKATTATSRKELVTSWQSVLSQAGDKTRGRDVFQKRCASCHQLDSVGFQVGPDLAALTNKSPLSLLVAVLDPNRDVDGRYVNYLAALADGRTLSGLLVNESANSVTLREQGGKDHVVLRNELEELRSTAKSVMPEGFEKDISQSEMADLIAYLVTQRIPPKSFAGNQPMLIKADSQGRLTLPARNAEIFGGEIAFESESSFQNIGYWHGDADFVAWQVDANSPGRFDVYLDYSCAAESAGNTFRFEGGEPVLRGVVAATGGWSNYRLLKIGAVELPAGKSYLTVRCDGPMKQTALFDLRTVYLVPPGAALPVTEVNVAVLQTQMAPDEVARRLLDDQLPAEARQKLIADHPSLAAEIIAAMVKDLPRDPKEEYRRIPWIWRVAISSGKRNITEELRAVLNVAMPNGGQPLRDWQAVVIGGGVINGITQANAWPKERIENVLRVEGILVARWQRCIELAASMANDEKVAMGTRYDALRMVAMGSWDQRSEQLLKYLQRGVHDELQMGAVSGIADMPHPQAASALLGGIGHYSERNRALALDGLIRSEDRCLALLDAVEKGQVSTEQLGSDRLKKLREHSSAKVRERAERIK